jgi:pSer/pThr/pTyr-binding forkhead associated (FHA) protein
MAALIVIRGPNEGSWYGLSKRTLTGGRDPANAIQIPSPRVSRKHFQLRHEDGLYLITDLKSHNGLYINGNRVQEALLKNGDEIQVGDAVLFFTTRDITDHDDALHQYKVAARRLRDDPTITSPADDV